jgi:large subunit ribosomal protein L3
MAAMLLGKKIGMTQIYDEDGVVVPITVIQAGPCDVMQVKTEDTDGYNALQLGFDDIKPPRRKKPQIGHAKKAGVNPKYFVRELRLADAPENEPGDTLTVEVFDEINYVDVIGTTKGRGYAGVVKRHGFKGQLASHGVERKHRSPGGIGSNSGSAGTSRGIRKGKKMAGHMGHERHTTKNLKLVGIDKDNNLLLVKGPVSGCRNGYLVVAQAKTKQ